jgi:16S rRNA (cytidine1402-2'-O)-methyltransferase
VSTLYLVATPIGNLEDISRRALRILGEVGLIAAEDTRKTKRLLTAYGIKTPLTSYHEHNREAKLAYLVDYLRERDVALVSEAGMPGMSDPGYELVLSAIEHGITVVPVPGPSALINAMVVSGLSTRQFTYLGFLPRKKGEKRRLLESMAAEPRTIVVFESPRRLQTTLSDVVQVLGDRRVAVCRELTKLHEEVFRGTVSEAIEHFSQPRGEFTLVIEGRGKVDKPAVTEEVEKELSRLRTEGVTAREATACLSQATGIPRKELYRAWLRLL